MMSEEELREIVRESFLNTARSILGDGWQIEAEYGDNSRFFPDILLVFLVVEEVCNPNRELSLSALNSWLVDAELGEELAFAVYHRTNMESPPRLESWCPLFSLPEEWSQFGRISVQNAKKDMLAAARDKEGPANDNAEV